MLSVMSMCQTLGLQKRKSTSLTSSSGNESSRTVPKYGSTGITGSQNAISSSTTSTLSHESLEPETETVSRTMPRLSALQILRDPIVHNVLISYGLLALTSTSNDIIFALWMFLPIEDGGIGFTVRLQCVYCRDLTATYTNHSHPR